MNIIPDQTDWTGSEYCNHLRFKNIICLLNRGFQFFFAAENYLSFLHIGCKTIGHKVMLVRRCSRIGLITPGQPGIKATSYRTMGKVDYITGWAHNHPLASGIATTPLGNNTRYGSHVGLYFSIIFIINLFIDNKMLGSFPRHLGRIFIHNLLFYLVSIYCSPVINCFFQHCCFIVQSLHD